MMNYREQVALASAQFLLEQGIIISYAQATHYQDHVLKFDLIIQEKESEPTLIQVKSDLLDAWNLFMLERELGLFDRNVKLLCVFKNESVESVAHRMQQLLNPEIYESPKVDDSEYQNLRVLLPSQILTMLEKACQGLVEEGVVKKYRLSDHNGLPGVPLVLDLHDRSLQIQVVFSQSLHTRTQGITLFFRLMDINQMPDGVKMLSLTVLSTIDGIKAQIKYLIQSQDSVSLTIRACYSVADRIIRELQKMQLDEEIKSFNFESYLKGELRFKLITKSGKRYYLIGLPVMKLSKKTVSGKNVVYFPYLLKDQSGIVPSLREVFSIILEREGDEHGA